MTVPQTPNSPRQGPQSPDGLEPRLLRLDVQLAGLGAAERARLDAPRLSRIIAASALPDSNTQGVTSAEKTLLFPVVRARRIATFMRLAALIVVAAGAFIAYRFWQPNPAPTPTPPVAVNDKDVILRVAQDLELLDALDAGSDSLTEAIAAASSLEERVDDGWSEDELLRNGEGAL